MGKKIWRRTGSGSTDPYWKFMGLTEHIPSGLVVKDTPASRRKVRKEWKQFREAFKQRK